MGKGTPGADPSTDRPDEVTGQGADEELLRQARHLAPLLAISPMATAITDVDGTVVAWNPAAERLFGYTAEEAGGRNLDDLVASTEEAHAEAVGLTRRASARDQVHTIARRTRKDGSLVDVELLAAPLEADGRTVGTLGVYHDITQLRRQKQYYEALLEVSPTAVIGITPEGAVTSWNPAAQRLFGYTAEEAIGRHIDDLVANREEVRAEALEVTRQIAEREVSFVARRTRKDGSFVDVQVTGAPIHVSGELVGMYGLFHDISELQRQKRYFQALVELSPIAIVVTDLSSRIVVWNPSAERLFGYAQEEAVGRHLDDLVANREDLREEANSFSEAAARGERVEAIRQRTRKDGTLVEVQLISESVVIGEERTGFLVMYHDISEIQSQKRWYQSALQTSPSAIVTIEPGGRVTSWNPAAEVLFGYTAEEAIGHDIDDLVARSPELQEEARGHTRRGLDGGTTRAITRRMRKDGTLVDVEMMGAPVTVSGEVRGHIVIYHDIGEIQRERRYYEALFQTSPVAVALLDPKGTVTAWNPAAERLFGYTPEEAIGRNVDDLVARREEVREEAIDLLNRGIGGELIHAITRRSRKDGSLVDVEAFGAPVMVAGEPAGLYAMYHDISELQRAREAAEAATEAKSAFLATMSHEIRTPLNAVIGMTGLLLDTELTPEQREFAEVIRSSGDALLSVINDILDFSKIEAGRLELEESPFDLRECVESALELVAAGALRKGLDLAYDLDPGVPRAIVGDLTRLRQILLNLLNNAVKFTERGEVVLTGDAERVADGRYRLHFAVRDTGIGVPEDRMNRLFESFTQVDASTNRRYGGTGLGLAISLRLVELMAGTMWAESQPGRGSTFHFTIEAEEAPARPQPFEADGVARLEGRRLLIVDDNATNRRIVSRQAESWGMLPRHTESPREALEWLRRGDPFDVAVLDMQMPDMDGAALAREIRSLRDPSSLPLVLLTSLGRTEASNDPFAATLTKPVRPSQLYEALIEVFGEAEDEAAPPVAPGPGERLADRLPLRVLVVEDNAVNQRLVLLLLEKMGYRADVAGNGIEALQALERQPYDVVLMDVEMPEMDGLEATRRIHSRWGRSERPHIVAVTANALKEERELCLAAGMDDYLSKPLRREALAGALGRVRPRSLEPVLDRPVLDRLVRSFGEDGRSAVAELVGTFLQDAPVRLDELSEAAERGDADAARRAAHTLKSNAATFGAAVFAGLFREIEARAAAGQLEVAGPLVERARSEWERVRAALDRVGEELA